MICLYDDIYITADSRQFILFEKKVIKKGKNEGEIIQANQKFYPNLSMIMDQIIHSEIFSLLDTETIHSLEEFKEAYTSLFSKLSKIVKHIEKHPDFQEILKDSKEVFLVPEKTDPSVKLKKKKLKKIKRIKK